MPRRNIEVWADWRELGGAMRMGTLSVHPGRGETFEFSYDPAWLKRDLFQALDPDLMFFSGPQYRSDRLNFGLFLDSAPDRWGRQLLDRREALRARKENRRPTKLRESDYLLGVFDGARMGGLRFRLEPEGPFLDDDTELASPPWTSLRALQQASLNLEKDGAASHPDYARWLQLLTAPGASLGGARPKASVTDEHGQLWIAKFPSRSDDHDLGGWEFVVASLARKSGLHMAWSKAEQFGSGGHTFLTRRFDRDQGQRLHFASALTVTGQNDGYDCSQGASYLELVEFLMTSGAQPEPDLEQLWRRIVFSMCVSNVDDHMRNHGFLLTARGWTLSPAYDVNPNPHGEGLCLNVSDSDNAQDLDLAFEVAPYFRLAKQRPREIIQEVVSVVRGWREEAKNFGLSRGELERMEPAFRVAEEGPGGAVSGGR